MEVTPVSQVPGHGESPAVTERSIITGIKTRLPVSSLNPNNSAFYPVKGGLV